MKNEPSVIVITDCGSTTTKAILIEKVHGVYRQVFRGEAPTTVESPVEDVTVGVMNALKDLSVLSNRKLIDQNGKIIKPAQGRVGTDLYLSTSSAGGGLQMTIAGVVKRISAMSAQKAALGAGAIVTDVFACDDGRDTYEQIEKLRASRPDMVLIAGGTDGGQESGVVQMAQLLAAADPRPRFGKKFKLPVIFAGNKQVSKEVARILGSNVDFIIEDNVRPSVDFEMLEPARNKIHDLFLEHVMQQAPGFSNLVKLADTSVMPTPSAVGSMLKYAASKQNINVLCVDIGGATTDVFSVIDSVFTRTVSANLGLSYSAAFVLAESSLQKIARWLPFKMKSGDLQNQIMNKTIRPTTVPDDLHSLALEQAIAREALSLSFEQHKQFATGLKGQKSDINIDGGFSTGSLDESLIDSSKLDLIIGSGGVLSHAPKVEQTVLMLIDAFLPTFITKIAKDSIFMLPHLGVLAQFNKDIAHSVYNNDCIVNLCTCVAPLGKGKLKEFCLEYSILKKAKVLGSGKVQFGQIKIVSIPDKNKDENKDEKLTLSILPSRKFDIGKGKGKKLKVELDITKLGIVFDCRGRPLDLKQKGEDLLNIVKQWHLDFGVIGTEKDDS